MTFLRHKMNLKNIDNQILANRGNVEVLDSIIDNLIEFRSKLDWQMTKFLNDHCKGVRGIELTDLDSNSPIYRYYNAKTQTYNFVERSIRVAEAYKK